MSAATQRQARHVIAIAYQRGFTLVELMISLILGLLVVAAAGTIFISNQRTYAATQSLDRVQESARVAFELMARDIREAGGSPCDVESPVASVLNTTPALPWYAQWFQGVKGYGATDSAFDFSTSTGGRKTGTEALELKSATAGASVSAHDTANARFTVDSNAHGLVTNDFAIVCDYGQTAIFRVTNAASTGNLITHAAATGAGQNCTTGLGLPVNCAAGTVYPYGKNSVVARVNATRWYVGNNDSGSTSLYRTVLRPGGVESVEEVVPDIESLRFEYLPTGSTTYRQASALTTAGQWAEIRSVRVIIGLAGQGRVGPSGEVIKRELAFVAALRNRNP